MARKTDSTDPPVKALPECTLPSFPTATWLDEMMSVPVET